VWLQVITVEVLLVDVWWQVAARVSKPLQEELQEELQPSPRLQGISGKDLGRGGPCTDHQETEECVVRVGYCVIIGRVGATVGATPDVPV
jgi:hypothetical protein